MHKRQECRPSRYPNCRAIFIVYTNLYQSKYDLDFDCSGNSFVDLYFEIDDIYQILRTLNPSKAAGPDGIHGKVSNRPGLAILSYPGPGPGQVTFFHPGLGPGPGQMLIYDPGPGSG